MKEYIGTKVIKAERMQKDGKEGYKVIYDNPNNITYESWSPLEVFEEAYKSSGDLSFGDAIHLMKKGYKLSRKGWNGKSIYIQYFCPVAHGLEEFTILDKEPTGTTKPLLPFLMMKTADDMFVPWLASHSDMLSSDWCIYE